jgi:hypothetical protein
VYHIARAGVKQQWRAAEELYCNAFHSSREQRERSHAKQPGKRISLTSMKQSFYYAPIAVHCNLIGNLA